MEQLPIYIGIVFILTTALALGLLYRAANYTIAVILITLIWLALQAAISLTGFYTITNVAPPRFGLLLIPPVIFILVLFLTKRGRSVIDSFDVKTLTLLHIVRIPVEITLFWLFVNKTIPGIMTFEGRNFDILCGLTAPLVYYFGYVKNTLSRNVLLAWNIICLLVVINIVVIALLSIRYPFQRFGLDQPNVALLYFPYIWLPGFVVPAVLFAHLATIRQLIGRV